MSDDNKGNLQRTAVQQSVKRMRWRCLAILACLLAYSLLGRLESAKESYDSARTRPIVIVSDQYVVDNANQSDNVNAQNIASSLGSKTCQPLPSPSPSEITNKQYNATLLRVCAVQGFLDNSPPYDALYGILEKKLMYQNFSNAAAIIDRLDQEILAEANLNKRAFLSTEEAENRARARKLPDLSRRKPGSMKL